MIFIDIPILALLVVTAVAVARMRDLWAAVMFTGIYSFLGASWMLILDAPDVSFTEAAVGAGISTVLMLGTLALTGKKEKPSGVKVIPLIVVSITGAALIYGTFDMPAFGDPEAPIQVYPNPSFVEKASHDMSHGGHGLPNVVTAVLASYRGYDTLGETAVIFTAGIAVLLILRKNEDDPMEADRMKSFPIIRVITKIIIPYILLFALYVQFHGDFGPGGGFQAGVIFASAFILYGLVFGLPAIQRVAPVKVVEKLIAFGLLIYAGTGIATMLIPRAGEDGLPVQSNFLDYESLNHHMDWLQPLSGQHLGIFLVELGVGITVTAVMTMIFYAFAGREPAEALIAQLSLEQFFGLYNYWIVIFLMMTGFYMVIARGNLIKTIIGLNIFQTSVVLLYVTMGKVAGGTAPIMPPDAGHGHEHDDHGHGHEEAKEHAAEHAHNAVGSLIPSTGSVEHADSTVQLAGFEDVAHPSDAAANAAEAAEILYSNPLPSVLMLTAIVVGVATTALALALTVRIREDYGTIEEDEILELDRAE